MAGIAVMIPTKVVGSTVSHSKMTMSTTTATQTATGAKMSAATDDGVDDNSLFIGHNSKSVAAAVLPPPPVADTAPKGTYLSEAAAQPLPSSSSIFGADCGAADAGIDPQDIPDAGSMLHEFAARTALALGDAVELAKSSVSDPSGCGCVGAGRGSLVLLASPSADGMEDGEEVATGAGVACAEQREGVESQAAASNARELEEAENKMDGRIEAGASVRAAKPTSSSFSSFSSSRSKVSAAALAASAAARAAGTSATTSSSVVVESPCPSPIASNEIPEWATNLASSFTVSAIADIIRARLTESVTACVSGDVLIPLCGEDDELPTTAEEAQNHTTGADRGVVDLHSVPSTASSICPLRSFASLLDGEAQGDTEEEVAQEILDRRIITANVLGSDVLESVLCQVTTDEESPCLKCGMPLAIIPATEATMKKEDRLDCVVCPALARKVRDDARKSAEQKRALEEAMIQAERAATHQAVLLKERDETIKAEEDRKRALKEREDQAKKERMDREAEEARKVEEARLAAEAAIAEEERRKEEEARAEEERKAEEARLAELAKLEEEERKAEEERCRFEEEARLAVEAHLDELALHAEKLERAMEKFDGEEKKFAEGGSEGNMLKNQSSTDDDEKRWADRRKMARTMIMQKMREGWMILSDTCEGPDCEFNPLLHHADRRAKLCAVCGGSGTGTDGAYATDAFVREQKPQQCGVGVGGRRRRSASGAASIGDDVGLEGECAPDVDVVDSDDEVEAPQTPPKAEKKTVELSPDSLRADRASVSREVGKLLLSGWSKVDRPCPVCFMPLMVPPNEVVDGVDAEAEGPKERCVVCTRVVVA